MKKLLFVFSFMFTLFTVSAQRVVLDDCRVTRYYGMESYSFIALGDVYVETNPKEPVELRVRVVTNPGFADFLVFRTSDSPKQCGEWRFVKDRSKAKFTIRYVKDGEDCTICFITDRSKAGRQNIIH